MDPPALRAADHASSAGLRHAAEVGPRELERGPDAEHDRGHDRQRGAEEQHRQVHLDDRLGGERVRWHPGNDQRETPPRDQHAQRRADSGDRQRLRQQLPHDAGTSRAERRAHGELLLAVGAAHEQQDRDVGAAHEQQRRHGAEQQKEPGAHRPREQLDDAAQVDAKGVRVTPR